jgi:hypothetical protein
MNNLPAKGKNAIFANNNHQYRKANNYEEGKTTMDMSGRVLCLPILDGTHAPDKLCHIGSGKGCKS